MSTSEEPVIRFANFELDTSERQLRRSGAPVDLTARYFDALVLLVRNHGRLVTKDQFFEAVWADVVVSDSALTQCVKDVRRSLGDDAANPRFIETVPRHGYRFIAEVAAVPNPNASHQGDNAIAQVPGLTRGVRTENETSPLAAAARIAIAGAFGGAFAGVLGGLIYGSALSYSPSEPGLGTASTLLVLVALNVIVGLAGGAGVSLGLAAARGVAGWSAAACVAGASLGGLIVGSGTKLLGLDAFNLLFGQAPEGITGGLEGAALGAALVLGALAGGGFRAAKPWRPAVGAAIACAGVGALIPVAGGNLMGGSLHLLAGSFSGSRLPVESLGRLFGEAEFGMATHVVLSGVEGLLFGACVAWAVAIVASGAPALTRDAARTQLAGFPPRQSASIPEE